MPTPEIRAAIRRRAVKLAARLLAELCGDGAPREPVRVQVSDGELEVQVVVVRRLEPGTRQEQGSDQTGTGQEVTGEIADMIRAVLETAERPTKLVVIAARARHEPTNYFRDVVRRMVASGEVRHLENPHRYWLASRAVPPGNNGQGSNGKA